MSANDPTAKLIALSLLQGAVLDKLVLYGIEYQKKIFTPEQFSERVCAALREWQDDTKACGLQG